MDKALGAGPLPVKPLLTRLPEKTHQQMINLKSSSFSLWMFLIFISLRLTQLLTHIEFAYNSEELYQGFIATNLLAGLTDSIWNYQIDHNYGGALVSGIISAPLFFIFGANLFALKFTALIFACGTFWFAYHATKEAVDRKTANILLILITFAPPTFLGLSLMTLGSHPESLCLSFGMLYFFFKALNNANAARYSAFLGLWSGFSVWFNNLNIFLLLTLIAVAWVKEKEKIQTKHFFLFYSTFIIGFLPWFFYGFAHGFESYQMTQEFLASGNESSILFLIKSLPKNIFDFFFKILPSFIGFKRVSIIPGYLFSTLYLGFILLITLPLFHKNKNALVLSLKIYALIIIIMGVCMPERINFHFLHDPMSFRHLLPLYLALFPLTAIGIQQSSHKKKWIISFLIFGLLGQSNVLLKGSFAQGFQMPGHTLDETEKWGHMWPLPENLETFSKKIAEQSPERRKRSIMKFIHKEEIWEKYDSAELMGFVHQLPENFKSKFHTLWTAEIKEGHLN